MRLSNPARFREQVRFLRRQFLQDGDLPFTDVLSVKIISQALTAVDVAWKDRIYTPLVTLWIFLGQVLDADHTCRAAVARFVAHRVSHGQGACSAKTGAYCQARKRLPEKLFSTVARHAGRTLDDNVDSRWLWKGRRVYTFDGSTVTMPDTPENQATYPQNVAQKPGLGFPIARIGALFSLSCGAIVDLKMCRYAGKGQSELAMLRKMGDIFRSGDILLGDRLLCAWTEISLLKQRGVDYVCRLNNANRTADFRRGKRLGKGDHIVRWSKAAYSRTLDMKIFKTLPEFLTVRECRIEIRRAGYRPRSLIVVTTLLDAEKFTKHDLTELYRARWNAELDLRSLKQTLPMDVLSCQTPEMVRKEIWTHVLAYNLIRTIMAQAAKEYEIEPRTVSFQGTVQTLNAFQPAITFRGQRDAELRQHLYGHLLACVASHRVGNRPGRWEPRQRKRRPRPYDRLMKPRHEAKLDMIKRVSDI
jgi:hypothetical protein